MYGGSARLLSAVKGKYNMKVDKMTGRFKNKNRSYQFNKYACSGAERCYTKDTFACHEKKKNTFVVSSSM